MMDEEQLKQALQDAFLMGQRYGCSYGMGVPLGTNNLKYEVLVDKWVTVLRNNGNCEGCY